MSLPLSVYKRMPKRMPYSLGFDRYALYFDGVDDYVEIPHSPSLNLYPNFTLEYIARWHSWTGIDKPLDKTKSSSEGWSHRYNADTRKFGFWDPVNTWTESDPVDLELLRWYHITVTYNGTVLSFYINGKLLTAVTVNIPSTIDSDESLRIGGGGLPVYPQPMNGEIAFVRIYNRPLSEKEIRYNMLNYHNPVRDGLVLWLDFEEGHGDKVYDKSGHGNHGTIYGGAKWVRVRQYELRAEVGL